MAKVWTSSTRMGGCLVLAAVWGMLVFPESALAKGKPVKGGGGKKQEIPVSVTFQDRSGDNIQSDGDGPYVTTKGKNKGKVFIGLGGQLRFGTGSSGSLLLNFTDITDTDPETGCRPFVSALTSASMVTLGADDDGDGELTPDQLNPGSQGDRWDLTRMKPGESARIGLQIGFNSGILWRVQFGDEVGATDLVTVLGLDDSDGDDFSDSWKIEAGPVDLAVDELALASLSKPDTDDFGSTIPCNFAFMPFAMTVVKD